MIDNTNQHMVYISGALLPRDEAKISVFDVAVIVRDTVTESTRTFAHKPFKLDQHIRRLYQSLKVTRIDPGMTPDEMHELSLRVLAANQHLLGPDDDCWLVHNISRGLSVAGSDPTVQRSPATIIIFTQPMILTDWARFYVEGGNFFIVADGVLKTPTTRNALAGISRATVLELAERLGFPARETDLQPYD